MDGTVEQIHDVCVVLTSLCAVPKTSTSAKFANSFSFHGEAGKKYSSRFFVVSFFVCLTEHSVFSLVLNAWHAYLSGLCVSTGLPSSKKTPKNHHKEVSEQFFTERRRRFDNLASRPQIGHVSHSNRNQPLANKALWHRLEQSGQIAHKRRLFR